MGLRIETAVALLALGIGIALGLGLGRALERNQQRESQRRFRAAAIDAGWLLDRNPYFRENSQ